eukprot:Lithocolla_globosa_v1_NODE_20_length_9637_cov_33.687643.p7 type:complete len:186 gc:universal NODE_20_length_9637_cov_33.687643:7236-6679(-)
MRVHSTHANIFAKYKKKTFYYIFYSIENMVNAWIIHVKSVQANNPGMSYKQAMVKAKDSYKKQKGKGVEDIVDSIGASTSNNDDYLKALDKGLTFTQGILDSDARNKRVTERSSRRDTRAKARQERRSSIQKAKADNKVAVQERKKAAIERKNEIKEAKHQKKLKKFSLFSYLKCLNLNDLSVEI